MIERNLKKEEPAIPDEETRERSITSHTCSIYNKGDVNQTRGRVRRKKKRRLVAEDEAKEESISKCLRHLEIKKKEQRGKRKEKYEIIRSE